MLDVGFNFVHKFTMFLNGRQRSRTFKGRGETGLVFVLAARSIFTCKGSPVVENRSFQDAVEKLLNIEESIKQTLTSTFTNEEGINLAREDDKYAISQLLKSQKLPAEKQTVQKPWTNLSESEMKIISRALENLREQDFSSKALKHWRSSFEGLFDKHFIDKARLPLFITLAPRI